MLTSSSNRGSYIDNDTNIPNAMGLVIEMQFAVDVLDKIDDRGIPSPSPLEQDELRLSARSTTCLSPAHSEEEEAAFIWFGIICYLPTQCEYYKNQIVCRRISDSGWSSSAAWDCSQFGRDGSWCQYGLYSDESQNSKIISVAAGDLVDCDNDFTTDLWLTATERSDGSGQESQDEDCDTQMSYHEKQDSESINSEEARDTGVPTPMKDWIWVNSRMWTQRGVK